MFIHRIFYSKKTFVSVEKDLPATYLSFAKILLVCHLIRKDSFMLNIQEFLDACREKGLNVTYQRILIYKSLMNSKNHPTAEDIYQQVKAEYPSISLATVYKTLEILAEHELIAKVTPLHDLARYDGDTSRHSHLVCLGCKTVSDIHDPAYSHLELPKTGGFRVSGYRIQFEGLCGDCQQRNATEPHAGESDPMTFCGKN